MANQPTINVAEIIKTVDPNNLIKYMKLPDQEIMSYEELTAWYKARRRNHHAINIFFNLLVVVLTGPLFHFIWSIIYRTNNYHHFNWLMRNRWYFKAETLLNAIEEKLSHTKEQYDEYLLDDQSQNYESSLDEQSQTSQRQSEKSEEPIESPTTQCAPIDSRYLTSPINTENPQSIKQTILHDHDLAPLWIAKLDDHTLIQSFIRPELTVRLRQLALFELFSRTSATASIYLRYYLSFYLSRQILDKQILSGDQIARFSVIHSTDLDIFVLAQSVRVKLGLENTEHISRILKSPFIRITSKSIRLLCETALNKNGMDIPFLITHHYADLVVTHPDRIFYAIGGDISKLAPAYHESIINALSENSYFYRLALDKWDVNDQKRLTKRILHLCEDFDSDYPNSFLWKLPVDQFDEAVLEKFVRDLLFVVSIRSNQTYRHSLHALCQVLKNTNNNKITQMIAKSLFNSLITLGRNKRLEIEHWTIPLISALCRVKYHHLTDEFKEKFVEQAHKIYKRTPTKSLALYLLSNLDLDDMSDKEENKFVFKCLYQKTRSQVGELIRTANLDNLDPANQGRILFEFLMLHRSLLELGKRPAKLPQTTQLKLNSFINKLVRDNLQQENPDNGIWVALLPVFTMDYSLVDSDAFNLAISMIKNNCLDPNDSIHYLLKYIILLIAPLIQLSFEEQSSFLNYLYALSHEREYLVQTLHGLHIINTNHLDDPSFENFCDWFVKLVDQDLEDDFIKTVIFPCIKTQFIQLNAKRKTVFFDVFRDYFAKLFIEQPNNTFHFLRTLPSQDTSLEDFLLNAIMKCIFRFSTEPSIKISAENIYLFILKLPIQTQHSIKQILFTKLEQIECPHLLSFNLLALMRSSSFLTTQESEMLNNLFIQDRKKISHLKLLPLFWNNRVTEVQKSTLSKIADNSYTDVRDDYHESYIELSSSDSSSLIP